MGLIDKLRTVGIRYKWRKLIKYLGLYGDFSKLG
jgi:hypothetical protein